MTQPFLPFALPEIGDEEIAEVVDTLRSGWVTTGPKAKRFEAAFTEFLGDPSLESLAVNSATAGLHLALEALGIGPGDEVITTTHTFTATAEVVRYLERRRRAGGRRPELYAVHRAVGDRGRDHAAHEVHHSRALRRPGRGHARDYRDREEARPEGGGGRSACAAHARCGGRLVGTLDSDITVFSFYANKTMTTGEGGMIVTRHPELAKRMKVMRLHGMSRDAFDRFTATVPSWYYEIVAPGFKYNLTDIAAALGLQQLKRIPAFQKRRVELAEALNAGLAGLPLILPPMAPRGDQHSWHLYAVGAPGGGGRGVARPVHRAPVRRRHRRQRALHPAAPAALLARPLRAHAAAVPAQPAGVRAHGEPALVHAHDRCGCGASVRRGARRPSRPRDDIACGAPPPATQPGFVLLSMILILIVSFVFALLATLAVIASAHRHAHGAPAHDLSGPQKMHVQAVPRVGGVGIFAGVIAGAASAIWVHPEYRLQIMGFVVCMLPALLSGLWEDFTKSISPRRRMVALALSGLLGVLLLNGVFYRTGWLPLDQLLLANGLGWVGTVGAIFAVTGVSNSINIIDGMNGLASMCVVLMACALAYISWQVRDVLVGSFALATLGATLGFFVWNYPRGLVFLGDGGAYVLGFIVAELGILLSARHAEVSMLAPLLIVVYPFFETLFSMYRRRFLQRRSMTQPDGIHLHTLIYRRLRRGAVNSRGVSDPRRANSGTSPYLWLLALVGIAPAAIWWHNSPLLSVALLAFVLIYLFVYWRIVRFRSPGWMKARRRGPPRGHGSGAP